MAIVKITERRAPDLNRITLSGTREFLVHTDSPTPVDEAEYMVRLDEVTLTTTLPTDPSSPFTAIPLDGDAWTGITDLFVTDIEGALFDDGENNVWLVTVTYGTFEDLAGSGGSAGGTFNTDPTSASPVFSSTGQIVRRKVSQDIKGRDLLNTACQFITKLPEVDTTVLRIDIFRRTSAASLITSQLWMGTLNNAAVTLNGEVFDPELLMLSNWKISAKKEGIITGMPGTIDYYDETLTLLAWNPTIEVPTWKETMIIQDLGTVEKKSPGQPPIRRGGKLINKAVNLNGAGLAIYGPTFEQDNPASNGFFDANFIAGPIVVKAIANGDGAILLYDFFETSDFSVIGL